MSTPFLISAGHDASETPSIRPINFSGAFVLKGYCSAALISEPIYGSGCGWEALAWFASFSWSSLAADLTASEGKRLISPLGMRFSGSDHCKMAIPQCFFSSDSSFCIDIAACREKIKTFFSWCSAPDDEYEPKPWPAGPFDLNMQTCSSVLCNSWSRVSLDFLCPEPKWKKARDVKCRI